MSWPAKSLEAAGATLEAHGDRLNAAHARYLEVRRLLLISRIEEAEHMLTQLDPTKLPPALRAVHELVAAGIALRRLQTNAARDALARARLAASQADIPALIAEVESASLVLNTPAARLIANGAERTLVLEDVEALQSSDTLVVDACRYVVREAGKTVSLASRPVLFQLARALGEAWPGDVSRDVLLRRAFGAKLADESHRARLRVEIGRLRKILRTLATISATKSGFLLAPCRARDVVVLARPVEEEHGAVLALLTDGESWSSLGSGAGTGYQPTQRAAGARLARGRRPSAGLRPRPGSPVDDSARSWIHDDIVTPRSAAE